MMENNRADKKLATYFEEAKKENPIVSLSEVEAMLHKHAEGNDQRFVKKNYRKYWLMAAIVLLSASGLFYYYNSDLKKPQPDSAASAVSAVSSAADADDAPSVSSALPENSPATTIAAGANTSSASTPTLNESSTQFATSSAAFKPAGPKTESNTRFYYEGAAEVSFTDQGKSVRIRMNDTIQSFYINDTLIAPDVYSEFLPLIKKAKEEKTRASAHSSTTSATEGKQGKTKKVIMNRLIRELQMDSIIMAGQPFEFRLNHERLYVNGIEKNHTRFTKYKALYEQLSGNRLSPSSPTVIIRHE